MGRIYRMERKHEQNKKGLLVYAWDFTRWRCLLGCNSSRFAVEYANPWCRLLLCEVEREVSQLDNESQNVWTVYY